MRDMKGAIWDALAMISLVNAGASGAIAWNEADLAFGKLHTDYSKRPAAHVYYAFNLDMTGDVVSTSSSDNSKIVLFAQRNGTWRKLCLVNRSGADQTLQLAFTGWAATLTAATPLTLKRASSSGFTTSSTPYGTLTNSSGLALPADTVTFLVVNENTLPPPAPTGIKATSGQAHVRLEWKPAARATSYRVNRATTSGGPYFEIATNLTVTDYMDTGLAGDVTVYYVISAINTAGESDPSAEIASVPERPRLGFDFMPGQITLNWATAAANHAIHRTTNLNPPVTWMAMTNNPVPANGLLRLALPTDEPGAFFRLAAP